MKYNILKFIVFSLRRGKFIAVITYVLKRNSPSEYSHLPLKKLEDKSKLNWNLAEVIIMIRVEINEIGNRRINREN